MVSQLSVAVLPDIIAVFVAVKVNVGVVTVIFTVCSTDVPAVFEHVSVYDLLLVRSGVVKD